MLNFADYSELTLEEIRAEIRNLKSTLELSLIPAPVPGATSLEVRQYRKQLVLRHLKTMFTQRETGFGSGKFDVDEFVVSGDNLTEVLIKIVTIDWFEDPRFSKKMYPAIKNLLLQDGMEVRDPGGFQAIRFHHFDAIAEIIAVMEDIPLHSKTRKELWYEKCGDKNYLARDATINYKINLLKELEKFRI